MSVDPHQEVVIDHACRQLVLLSAEYADTQQPTLLAALFSEDGTLRRPNAEPLVGRAAIERSYAQRPADRLSRHLLSNIRVAVASSSSASALSYVLLWTGSAQDEAGAFGRPAAARQVVGEFHDRFVLTPEGWRIAEREARFVLFTE